jgi:hypothetical protein
MQDFENKLIETYKAGRASRLEKYGTMGLVSMANILKERIEADLNGLTETSFDCGACVSNEDGIVEILTLILEAYQINRSE